jgi:hypothetical protein
LKAEVQPSGAGIGLVVLKIEGRGWPWQSFGDHQAIGNAENPVWGDLFIGWGTPKMILFVFQRRGA